MKNRRKYKLLAVIFTALFVIVNIASKIIVAKLETPMELHNETDNQKS